jgi:divalent metal cation (Fe/Co/Zn/Cd) transporter
MANDRATWVRRGWRLEWLTLSWNLAEGAVAIVAALAARSVVLLGFGVDSLVECASSMILLWRLAADRRTTDRKRLEQIDRKAHRLVGASLFALAAFIVLDAGKALWWAEHAESSTPGLVVAALAIPMMWWLARAKRRVARAIASRALEADSFQTTACMWLSAIAILGAGANAAFGWWWADPGAALGMTYFLIREGREAWRGEHCCEPVVASRPDDCCNEK